MNTAKYSGSLFSSKKQSPQQLQEKVNTEFYKDIDLVKLIHSQAELLVKEYSAVCFDVKQLQEILNVGETNAYALLKNNELPYIVIGRRKVVPVMALATYLVCGKAS